MSRLLLRFQNTALSEFHWAVVDESLSSRLSWQTAAESELSGIIAQHSFPAVIILPQQAVYITEFEMPEKASRQVLASIEYQIEDQLAQDTELQHYAIGKQVDNKVPVVVVEQSIMQACQSLQGRFGLRIIQIIPEFFLCPAPDTEGTVNVLESHEGFILRYGTYRVVKSGPDLLKPMLAMINREHTIERVNYYLASENDFEHLHVDKYEAKYHSTSTLAADFDSPDIINLQQRQFQASSNWNRLFQAWKSVAAVLVLLLSVTILSRVMALQKMEAELDSIKASQYELVKDYLDDEVTQSDNLKTALIKRLQAQNTGQQGSNFIGLLVEFGQARSKYNSIEIVKVGYQQGRLNVDISSKQLNDVEALHAALNARGLSTRLEKLSIKPELVSGQFIIEAGDNG